MLKLTILAAALLTFTLPVPLMVLAATSRWRDAFTAWAWFGGWMGFLYFIAFLVWLGTATPF